MAYTDMALPLDVTWRRLAASWDMMDREPDRRFPPKWRSTISVFCYEPPELPEAYCERAITYLKIVCSITGFQSGAETALELPDDQPFGTKETELGARYYACYGALLQVSVFPGGGESVPLADYPYIIDFEPKRRELYEAVTQSGEILGRSTSALNVRKGATSGETTEISSKIGAEVKGSYFGLVEGRVTGEHAWGGGTHTEEQNVRTTDDSRERRETYSATTSLTQMYELFTGYHLGANRALFYMNARPHTVEDKDRYTFVNGPRRLEGIQEVFVIVNRPRDQKSLCVEAYVETGHLDLAETAPASTDPKPVPELEPKETTLYWLQESVPAASGIVLHKTVLTLGKDCKLDTTRGGGLAGSRTVPSGISVVFRDDDTANEYLYSITLEPITGDDIVLTLTFPEVEGLSVSRKLSIDVTVFYLCPGGVAEPTPRPPAKLFLTARGVRACVKLTQERLPRPRPSSARSGGRR